MRNAEIAAALDELGTLYELDGAVRYRVLAYHDAAKTVRESPVSVEELARAGRATEMPGIGKTLQEKINTLLDTGEIMLAGTRFLGATLWTDFELYGSDAEHVARTMADAKRLMHDFRVIRYGPQGKFRPEHALRLAGSTGRRETHHRQR